MQNRVRLDEKRIESQRTELGTLSHQDVLVGQLEKQSRLGEVPRNALCQSLRVAKCMQNRVRLDEKRIESQRTELGTLSHQDVLVGQLEKQSRLGEVPRNALCQSPRVATNACKIECD